MCFLKREVKEKERKLEIKEFLDFDFRDFEMEKFK